MDPLLATLVLILLALLGARFSFSTERVSSGPRLVFRTGVHFLFFGFILGPAGLAFLTEEAVQQLNPLLALGLGWVGLLFGMQLDRESLSRFPLGYHLLALGQAVLTFFLFFGVGWLGLGILGLRGDVSTVLLLGAAATACITTPAGVAVISANFLVRGRLRELLFFIASVDAFVGIVALQFTYSYYHPAEVMAGLGTTPGTFWMALGIGIGIVCGILFLWLSRPRPTREELVLYLLGIAALGSGAALQLQISPLFVCVVMGILVANMSPERQRVFQALQKWEKPIYVVFLLLAGALLSLPTWWVVPLALLYALTRGVGKVVASAVLVPVIRLPEPAPAHLGLGLMPQGGISLAMAGSGVLTYAGMVLPGGLPAEEMLFTVIVLGVVLSELVGPPLTMSVLRRAGEISPRVEEALELADRDGSRSAAVRHEGPPGKGGG